MSALLLAACAGQEGMAPPAADGAPDQVLGTFTMETYKDARRVWSLEAPAAEIFETDQRAEIEQPRLHFYEDDGPRSTVTAARGRFNTATRDMWAGGGVVMISTDGARLESDWMNYESAANRITSTAPVTITRGQSEVKGIGWEARPDLSELIVRRQRGEIAPEDAPLLRLP